MLPLLFLTLWRGWCCFELLSEWKAMWSLRLLWQDISTLAIHGIGDFHVQWIVTVECTVCPSVLLPYERREELSTRQSSLWSFESVWSFETLAVSLCDRGYLNTNDTMLLHVCSIPIGHAVSTFLVPRGQSQLAFDINQNSSNRRVYDMFTRIRMISLL
jgi:hypothetical protein